MDTSQLFNPHLEGGPFFWEAGPVGVFLSHGFTATCAEARPLAKRLHADGFSVAGPLLPGHGSVPQDLNRVCWQDWARAGEETYQQLKMRCERVFVGGESMGAVLALYLASQHPEAAGVLAFAPALKLNLRTIDLLKLRLLAPFVRWVPKQSLDGSTNWQGYPVNPLKGSAAIGQIPGCGTRTPAADPSARNGDARAAGYHGTPRSRQDHPGRRQLYSEGALLDGEIQPRADHRPGTGRSHTYDTGISKTKLSLSA